MASFSEVKYNHHFHYDVSDKEKLMMMLKIDKELNFAYEIYHRYLRFNDYNYSNLLDVRNELNEIICELKLSGISECQRLSYTLENWQNEIINSFKRVDGYRISNGPMEGRNSYIKKILRLANDYANFERFRNRIIYSLNKYANHNFESDNV